MKEANEHELKSIAVRNHQLDLRRQELENERNEQLALEELHRKRKQEQGAHELFQFQQRIANVCPTRKDASFLYFCFRFRFVFL
jgi:hypothetical protein